VKDFFAAIGRGDRQALLALVAEDIKWIIPGEDWPLAGTYRGHPGLADLLDTASSSMETSTEPREFVAQRDRVLVVGFASGKIKATNKPSRTNGSSPSRLMQVKCATAADFNRAVYKRLKPGGFYVIVDHTAAAGAGTGDAQSLHRIDPASVREEVEAAGFVLDAESTLLANRNDPHAIKVYDPLIQGETDRFAYRFVKP
jgi:hypothetical protein